MSPHVTNHSRAPVTRGTVLRAWWPLALSWMMMGLELPLVSAVMARFPDPEVTLAAFGGVVFPIAMVIEGPIIMLLSASTALARDRASYLLIRRFMWTSVAVLTGLHVAVAFTPLFDVVAGGWLGVPPQTIEPARVGLQLMTPWTGAIAYRRFQQGILIRFEHSRRVGAGTAVRLLVNMAVLVAGALHGNLPGIVIGASAIAAGVLGEALFIGLVVRPVLRRNVLPTPTVGAPLRLPEFLRFYIPLALTPLITLAAAPLASAAMSRMPRALDSLAIWPVVNGGVFLLRGLGFAFNEVVVALLERPGALPRLRRFAQGLAVAVSVALLLAAATPLGRLWFEDASGLNPELVALALAAIWAALAMPALAVQNSWVQGLLVHGRRTHAVTEGVLVYGGVYAAGLAFGVVWGGATGIFVALAATTLGGVLQNAWMARRAQAVVSQLEAAPERPA